MKLSINRLALVIGIVVGAASMFGTMGQVFYVLPYRQGEIERRIIALENIASENRGNIREIKTALEFIKQATADNNALLQKRVLRP